MKSIRNLLLVFVSALFLSHGLIAMNTEETYIASYRGRTDIPTPVVVVTPEVSWKHDAGVVHLTFTVDDTGTPRDIAVVGKVDEDLAGILTEALREWKFNPALVEGKPVAKKVSLPFVIHGDAVANVRVAAVK